MNIYLYIFYEDTTVEVSLVPPTESDIELIEDRIIDVVKIQPNNHPLYYDPNYPPEEVWQKLDNCEFISIDGDLCHLPAGSDPYNDEEE